MPAKTTPKKNHNVDGHNDYLSGLMKSEQKMTKRYWAISVLSMSVFAIATACAPRVFLELNEVVELPEHLGLTFVFRLLTNVSLVTFYNGFSHSPFVAFIDKVSRNTDGMRSDKKKGVKVKTSRKSLTSVQNLALACFLTPLVFLCDDENFWDTVIKQHSDSLVLFILTAPLLWSTQSSIMKKLSKFHPGEADKTFKRLFLNDVFVHYQRYKDSRVSIDAFLPFLLGPRDIVSVHFLCPLLGEIGLNPENKQLHFFSGSYFSLTYHYVLYSFYRDFLYQKLDKTLSSEPRRHAGAFLVFFAATTSVISLYALGDFASWASSLLFLFDTALFWIAMYVDIVNLKTSEKLLQAFSASTQAMNSPALDVASLELVDNKNNRVKKGRKKGAGTPKSKRGLHRKDLKFKTKLCTANSVKNHVSKVKPKARAKRQAEIEPPLEVVKKLSVLRKRSDDILCSEDLRKLNKIINCVNNIAAMCFKDEKRKAPIVSRFAEFSNKDSHRFSNKFLKLGKFYKDNLYNNTINKKIRSYTQECVRAIGDLTGCLNNIPSEVSINTERNFVEDAINKCEMEVDSLLHKCEACLKDIASQKESVFKTMSSAEEKKVPQAKNDVANAKVLDDNKLFDDYCHQYITLTGPFALSHGEGNLKDRRFSSTTFPFRYQPAENHLTDYFYSQLVPAIVKIASLLDLEVYISGYAANYPAYMGKGDLDLKIFGPNDRLPDAVEIFKRLLTRFISQNLNGEYNEQASTGTTLSSLYSWQERRCDSPAVACSATLKTDYELPEIDITVCRGQADVSSPLNLTAGLLQLCISNTTLDTETIALVRKLQEQYNHLNALNHNHISKLEELRSKSLSLLPDHEDVRTVINSFNKQKETLQSRYAANLKVTKDIINHLSDGLVRKIKSNVSVVFFSRRVLPIQCRRTLGFFKQIITKSLSFTASYNEYAPRTVNDLLFLLKNMARIYIVSDGDNLDKYLDQENIKIIARVFLYYFNNSDLITAGNISSGKAVVFSVIGSAKSSDVVERPFARLRSHMQAYLHCHFDIAIEMLQRIQKLFSRNNADTRLGNFLASLPSPDLMNPEARPFTPSV